MVVKGGAQLDTRLESRLVGKADIGKAELGLERALNELGGVGGLLDVMFA